ncbi:MAG: TauD/TfdA family dioxygenase [Acidimicrobiales bacterium]
MDVLGHRPSSRHAVAPEREGASARRREGPGQATRRPDGEGNELGGVAQAFHSDGSDLVGLMCLDPGVSGGESLVANAVAAYNLLVESDPELAAVLFDGLPYDFRGEQADGATPYYHVPVFSEHGDRLFVRYIRPYIEASQRHPDAPGCRRRSGPRWTPSARFVHDPANRVEMTFEPGDIQFVNNYHVLHGRRAYVDDPESGRVRWLKRLWLATDILGPDDRPAFPGGRRDRALVLPPHLRLTLLCELVEPSGRIDHSALPIRRSRGRGGFGGCRSGRTRLRA